MYLVDTSIGDQSSDGVSGLCQTMYHLAEILEPCVLTGLYSTAYNSITGAGCF